MKIKSAILVLLVTLFSGFAQAATVSVGRGIGNPGVVASVANLFPGSHTPLSAGGYYIAVGTFTNASGITEEPVISPNSTSLLEAVMAFDVFASTTAPVSPSVTVGTITGAFTSAGGSDPSVFNLKPIYFLIGDGSSLATSTVFGIFKVTGAAFPANVQGATGPSVTIANGAAITPLQNAGYVDGNYFVLGVPEPSVALLGLLGAVGLIRRRR